MTDRTAMVEEVMREYDALSARMADFSGPTFLGLDITMPQAKILHLIRATGSMSMSMSDLVARLGVTVPTVTGIVDRLVERDLVVRRGTPDDRRRVLIEITPAGVAMIDGMRDLSAAQVLQLLTVLDERELGTFLEFLRVLESALVRCAVATATPTAAGAAASAAAAFAGGVR